MDEYYGNGDMSLLYAFIIAIPAVISPMFALWYTARTRRLEKKEDYERQDKVAEKAAEAAKAAVTATKVTNTKLDVIHTLVNSNMTAALQAELDARREGLAQMMEIIDLKKASGKEPTPETIEAVGKAKGRIVELEATLADRLKRSKKIEKIQSDKMIADMKVEAAVPDISKPY